MKVAILTLLASLLFFSSAALALFDTGTALEKGKLEIDAAVNPFSSITYGQNFVFLHYGLGNYYEVHGYLSKWGTIFDWDGSTYETYFGILKQWAAINYLDLATAIGIRQINRRLSLIGPGVLYTLRMNQDCRLAGHLQYIGEIFSQDENIGLRSYNNGYTTEAGFYWLLRPGLEIAFGAFTNSTGDTRPIYTFNFYF